MATGTTVEQDGDDLVIRIPMKLRRRHGRKQIIVPESFSDSLPASEHQDALVDALARAFHWQEIIESGRYGSITRLADALGNDRSCVGRVLRLTLLAPDIVETILLGREQSGLLLRQLTKEIPMLWEEQRKFSLLRSKNRVCSRSG